MIINQDSLKNCRFFAGDWESFNDLLAPGLNENNKFDYIFTSETIYNVDSYPKICNIFKRLLKRTGIMYPFINLDSEIVIIVMSTKNVFTKYGFCFVEHLKNHTQD